MIVAIIVAFLFIYTNLNNKINDLEFIVNSNGYSVDYNDENYNSDSDLDNESDSEVITNDSSLDENSTNTLVTNTNS